MEKNINRLILLACLALCAGCYQKPCSKCLEVRIVTQLVQYDDTIHRYVTPGMKIEILGYRWGGHPEHYDISFQGKLVTISRVDYPLIYIDELASDFLPEGRMDVRWLEFKEQ